jgi:putative tricarboxylic transport membrane protein
MELIHNLALGFSVAFTAQNLLYAFIGCVLGTLIGVLPGLGPVATIAMLLPSVYSLDATPALIMLAGIYYGAQYGGSTTSILINVPGESSSVVTALDGHQMARQGRAGAALSVAALGSFFAGCVGTVLIAAFAPLLITLSSQFGAAEYFSLMVLGLVGAVALASGSLTKALAMVILGLLLGQINRDLTSGVARFSDLPIPVFSPEWGWSSLNLPELSDGIGFVVIAMGMFGFGEIIANLGHGASERELSAQKVQGLMLTRQDFKAAWPAVLRGTTLGSILGVLPGGGAILASFAAYAVEKKLAGPNGKFGQGDIRGVAAPEAANNAGAQTSFIPMLTLGIPANAVMALMVGAMTIKGIQPGPQVMASNPDVFWGLIVSMWVGNAMLVILNLPLIGIWVKLLRVPYRFLFPAIALFCCIGAYCINNSSFDLYMMALFAFLGYVFHKLKCESAPLLLGFILGPMMEEYFRRALLLSGGNWHTFAQRPVSAGLLITALVLITSAVLPMIARKREEAFQEE